MIFPTREAGALALLSNALRLPPLSDVPERTVAGVVVSRWRHSMLAAAAVFIAAASTAPASAGQISYNYDARGRLVQVDRIRNTGSASKTLYTYDAADNRTSRVAQGAGAAGGLAIVPHAGGYRIIHLNQ